eukprot:scaffold296_cov102-Amphora_coffeaeformis.AAC.27
MTNSHQQPPPADDEGWHTVSAKDKKRVMRQKGRRKQNGVAHPTVASQTAVENISELEQIVLACRQTLQKTTLYREILEGVIATLETPEILCLGMGNFSKTHGVYFSASLWQLACLLQMRDDLEAKREKEGSTGLIKVYFYDPISTDFEKKFLQQNQILVLQKDEQGKRKLQPGALVFLPHCPAILYENLLQTNPHIPSDNQTVLLGNSIQHFCEALTPTVGIATLQARVDALEERRLTVEEGGQPGDFDKAFNDTYIIRGKSTINDTK